MVRGGLVFPQPAITVQEENQPAAMYDFGYKILDEKGNSQFRQEASNGKGGVIGSYGYTDKHGLYRKVIYVADKWGYRASVHTNEPGTANQNPADVQMKAETPPPLPQKGHQGHHEAALYDQYNQLD